MEKARNPWKSLDSTVLQHPDISAIPSSRYRPAQVGLLRDNGLAFSEAGRNKKAHLAAGSL